MTICVFPFAEIVTEIYYFLQISKTVEIPFKIQFDVIDENDFDEDGK
ncbi:hypothetical protein SRABI27_03493 [Pedobacter sp. Bi27]|nr:hypothetical protein SRABI36_00951 [Pedobacter sp. Bi36]CAH0213904.1 hypothetical protein SRABI126_02043 [Pedobacter sp. Bi126]CAH0270991.1 hypothetical protein SRABI27_03493 [Pedobacter sp. Bi27]